MCCALCGCVVCFVRVCVSAGPLPAPPPDRPKFRAFFPPPLPFLSLSLWGSLRVFFSLSGVFSKNFGGVFEAGPSNVHVWALKLS